MPALAIVQVERPLVGHLVAQHTLTDRDSSEPKWHTGRMDDPTIKIGRYLREAREGRKLSQAAVAEELAERTGGKYLHTTIGKIETGKRGISLIEAANLADMLGIKWNALFEMMKPTTPKDDINRISNNFFHVQQSLHEDVLPFLHLSGVGLKDFKEKYSETREINDGLVNEILDRSEKDLELVRSIYAWMREAESFTRNLHEDYNTAQLIAHSKDAQDAWEDDSDRPEMDFDVDD